MLEPSRRQFVISLSAAASASLFAGTGAFTAEPPPETTAVGLLETTAICFAPVYVIETFLRAEDFTDIRHVSAVGGFSVAERVGRGEIDFGVSFAGTYHLDAGLSITALGGLYVGCYELFARAPNHSISDLKGRRGGIQTVASSAHLYLSVMATHIGLDAQRDIEWVTSPEGDAMERFIAGETDAFLGFPPEPQGLRTRGHCRVILNAVLGRHWSQYFCCMMYGNATWVRDHPIATKRFLRAMYRAADFCTAEPAKAAREVVDRGFAERYDYALQTIEEIAYDLWHEYDAEDLMRFYTLRLREAGMLRGNPNALLAAGNDWRFLNDLKRELKT